MQEEKEARKERKLQKKLNKKSPLTKEQKYYKIAGVIVGILVTFGAILYSCNAMAGDGYEWTDLVGITDEMIEELEKPVDENLLFSNGKLSVNDLNSCKAILDDAGANVLDNKEEVIATKSFTLNSKEVGALAKQTLLEGGSTLDILDFEIYYENDCYYEKSIVKINLKEVVEGEDLPTIYLQSTSKIDILGESICILDTKYKINMIEEDINNSIIELLEKYSKFTDQITGNDMINMVINLFATNVGTKINLQDNGIEFKVKS